MQVADIPTGSALFEQGTSYISHIISHVEDSPLTHVAMLLDGTVYEMTWPRLRAMPFDKWLARATKPLVGPLKFTLSSAQESAMETWWVSRLGRQYDWALILALDPVTRWQRFSTWLNLPVWMRCLQPAAGNGVCSTNVAWAWEAGGIVVPETTGATPADIATWNDIIGIPQEIAL